MTDVVRVVTDGTVMGTKVLDAEGNAIKGVVDLRIEGRSCFVTRRHRDVEIVPTREGLPRDLHLRVGVTPHGPDTGLRAVPEETS